MGTLTIYELSSVGGAGAVDGAPVVNLDTILRTTVDAATSTSPTTLELLPETRFVIFGGVEDHLVSTKDSTFADKFATVPAGQQFDTAVNSTGSSKELYYRSVA